MNIVKYIKLLGSVVLLSIMVAACAPTSNSDSTGELIDDSAITTKAKTQLLTAPGFSSLPVSVETHKGVVQLSGFVDSQAAKQRAEGIAWKTPGVKKVINNLVVK